MILLAALALSSVVYLERRPPGLPSALGLGATGSGFVIASTPQESYVLTAAHVLGCDTYGAGCADSVELRFTDEPEHVWQAERAYSGSALTEDDLAVLVVRRGQLQPLKLGVVKPSESVSVSGFPQSLVARAAQTSPIELEPRTLVGSAGDPLRDQRMLLSLRTEPGDSGAPVLDRNGDVVGVLQGRQDATYDIAVAGDTLRTLFSLVSTAASTQTGGSTVDAAERGRAFLLMRNAIDWEAIRQRYYGIGGTTEIEQTEDADFGDAVAAGSLDAASEFLRTYADRTAIYTPSGSVTQMSLALARAAADRGNLAAAYDVHLFLHYRSLVSTQLHDQAGAADNTALSTRYFNIAVAGGYPFALLELSGTKNDQAFFLPLQVRAMAGFASLAAAGDPEAAYQYAVLYSLRPRSPPDFGVHDPVEPQNYIRAVELGASEAVPGLLLARNQLADPTEALRIAEAEVGRNWFAARSVADIYAKGEGVPRDTVHALDLYARSYLAENFQTILEQLSPEVADAVAGIAQKSAVTVARRALVFVAADNSQDAGYGVTVYSDSSHSIVAVSSSILHCDAFQHQCRPPPFLYFYGAGEKREYPATIALANGNTLEYGVALLDVTAPNEPFVSVATAPGPLAFTLDSSLRNAYVGLMRGVDEAAHIVRVDVPWSETSSVNAVFDLANGDLVGLANDPTDLSHATGPAAIRAALKIVLK